MSDREPTAAFWREANAEAVKRLGEEQDKVLRLAERVTMLVDQRNKARTERDAARTALRHLAPWAVALLDAGLVRDEHGWCRADGTLVLGQSADGGWWRDPGRTRLHYRTEEEAAGAWLAAQGGTP